MRKRDEFDDIAERLEAHGAKWCGENGCVYCEQPGWEDDPPMCPICDKRAAATCCPGCGWKAKFRQDQQAHTAIAKAEGRHGDEGES